jgi:hypothetical protein
MTENGQRILRGVPRCGDLLGMRAPKLPSLVASILAQRLLLYTTIIVLGQKLMDNASPFLGQHGTFELCTRHGTYEETESCSAHHQQWLNDRTPNVRLHRNLCTPTEGDKSGDKISGPRDRKVYVR